MSGFQCSCDYELVDAYSATCHKARTPKTCDECDKTILPGEKYERVWMKQYGDILVFNTCYACLDLRTWVKNNIPCFCFAHRSMLRDAEQTIKDAIDYAPDETRGLLFGFLRRMVIHKRARLATQRDGKAA